MAAFPQLNGPFSRPSQSDAAPLYVLPDRGLNPTDTPQSVKFAPSNSALFSCISWDRKWRLYSVSGPQNVTRTAEIALSDFPLSQSWNAVSNACFVTLGDGSLVYVDPTAQSVNKFGAHSTPLLQVFSYARGNFLLAIDNDKNLLIYALNAATKAAPDFALKFAEQPFSFAVDGNTALFCLANNKIAFIDLGAVNQYKTENVQICESQLGAPLSTAWLDEQTREYFLGSVDGRVYKGYYNTTQRAGAPLNIVPSHNPSDNARNFTFLAQARKRPDGHSDLYSINAMGGIARSRQFLFTAGSDAIINFWDVKERNKIAAFNAPGPVTCCDISADGNTLAFGVGYDWSQGLWGLAQSDCLPAVGIKRVLDSELSFKRN